MAISTMFEKWKKKEGKRETDSQLQGHKSEATQHLRRNTECEQCLFTYFLWVYKCRILPCHDIISPLWERRGTQNIFSKTNIVFFLYKR